MSDYALCEQRDLEHDTILNAVEMTPTQSVADVIAALALIEHEQGPAGDGEIYGHHLMTLSACRVWLERIGSNPLRAFH